MGYPEEEITYCARCRSEVPPDCFWRGKGYLVTHGGREIRTAVLHCACPHCGAQQYTGLEGLWPYRVFYAWLWRLRYPRVLAPLWVPATPIVDEEEDEEEGEPSISRTG